MLNSACQVRHSRKSQMDGLKLWKARKLTFFDMDIFMSKCVRDERCHDIPFQAAINSKRFPECDL